VKRSPPFSFLKKKATDAMLATGSPLGCRSAVVAHRTGTAVQAAKLSNGSRTIKESASASLE
jgi:hypothetical protein